MAAPEPTTVEPTTEPELYSSVEPTTEPEYMSTAEPTSLAELYSSVEPTTEPEYISTEEPTSLAELFSSVEPTSEPEYVSTSEPVSLPEFYSSVEPTSEPEFVTSGEPISYPEGHTSVEPTIEPELHSSSEPEFLSSPEPEGESSSVFPEGEPVSETVQSFAEPVPDWKIAKPMYSGAWELHIYVVAILFTLVAIAALINIVRLVRRKDLKSRGYFISLNIMMFILGVVRALYFYIDGYNSNNTFPLAVAYFAISIAFPCLTAAFYILFSALLRSLRLKYMSPRIFSPGALIGIISFNFVLSLTTDFIVGYFFEVRYLILFCQITYALWGILFSISFIVLFVRLYRATQKRNRDVMRLDSVNVKTPREPETPMTTFSSQTSIVPKFSKMALSVKISFVVCIFFMCITILNIVNMVSDMGIMTNRIPEPWSWWFYHFVYRLCEFGMAATIVYVGHLPFRNQDHDNDHKTDEGRYKKYSDV